MDKKEFDESVSLLLTEKKLLLKSVETSSEEVQEEIRKRIIHINSEINMLKNKYNKERGEKND